MEITKINIANRDELIKRVYELTSVQHDLVVGGVSSHKIIYDYGFDPAFKDLLIKVLSVLDPDYRIEDTWFNIYKKGGYVKEHNHKSEKYPNSKTGVYYLKKPLNSGDLYIENKKIDLEEDDFIIFDGHKNHFTSKNETNEDRVIVSFNFVYKIKQ